MRSRELRRMLRERPAERELAARERSWEVVRVSHARRSHAPSRRSLRLAAAGIAAVALIGLVLSPAGGAVRDWVGEVVEPGVERAAPSLTELRGGGRLAVDASDGPWVVEADGSKRLLGDYETATWSPRGLYLAVAADRSLAAVEPDGDPRWTIPAPGPVKSPRWAPTGIRVAYLSAGALAVAAGDGTTDRVLDERVASVAPAWAPEPENTAASGGPTPAHLLAYVDSDGAVRLIEADSGEERWATAPIRDRPLELAWSATGRKLHLLMADGVRAYSINGRELERNEFSNGALGSVMSAAPAGPALAVIRRDPRLNTSYLSIRRGAAERDVFSGPGRFTGVSWSPTGEWLLLEWRDADQWLFIRPATGQVRAVSRISRQFDLGEADPGFPRVAGWCC